MKSRFFISLVTVLWLCGIGLAQHLMLRYETTPAKVGVPAAHRPSSTSMETSQKLPSLVIAMHPQCPCSRATMEELQKLMRRCKGQLMTTILFYKPSGSPDGWEKTGLWQNAVNTPGVQSVCDIDGAQASRFGLNISGQVNFYSTAGDLLFTGGITESRGHAGDNAGVETIVKLCNSGTADIKKTPVFGCSIRG